MLYPSEITVVIIKFSDIGDSKYMIYRPVSNFSLTDVI